MSESTNPRSLAIQALILDRCRALGLSRSELASSVCLTLGLIDKVSLAAIVLVIGGEAQGMGDGAWRGIPSRSD